VRGAYLLALAASLAGVAVLDARLRLVVWRPGCARRATGTLAIGVVGFLAWDAAGIALGIFRSGHGRWSTGVDLAPQLPLEEPVFLLFLCYLALVVVAVVLRATDRRTPARKAVDGGER
jgi:lycopene cyclase domain-containing protein